MEKNKEIIDDKTMELFETILSDDAKTIKKMIDNGLNPNYKINNLFSLLYITIYPNAIFSILATMHFLKNKKLKRYRIECVRNGRDNK